VLVHGAHVGGQMFAADVAIAGGTVRCRTRTSGSEKPRHCCPQDAAHELDPEQIAIGIDQGDHLLTGGRVRLQERGR
jgi:hypothetical protein